MIVPNSRDKIAIELKIQSALQNRKCKKLYGKLNRNYLQILISKIYPTGSAPGKFYEAGKIYKLSPNGSIDKLPLRPIV